VERKAGQEIKGMGKRYTWSWEWYHL